MLYTPGGLQLQATICDTLDNVQKIVLCHIVNGISKPPMCWHGRDIHNDIRTIVSIVMVDLSICIYWEHLSPSLVLPFIVDISMVDHRS